MTQKERFFFASVTMNATPQKGGCPKNDAQKKRLSHFLSDAIKTSTLKEKKGEQSCHLLKKKLQTAVYILTFSNSQSTCRKVKKKEFQKVSQVNEVTSHVLSPSISFEGPWNFEERRKFQRDIT